MPTYVYKFVETGETIEVHQAFSDEALSEAVNPRTGTTMAVKKVFQPIGITFKGGGFYKTDARSGGSSKTASSGADTAGGAGAASAGSSEGTGGTAPTPSAPPASPPTGSAAASGGS